MSWPPASTPRGHPIEPGPPVFPGPLYPPDAAPGHTPSSDGPLALAVKRWAAHLGAWPWDPDSWDDSYSNRFAHGDHPDTHAGVAGIQRWAKITPASGWFGTGTYNFARSVLIPQGRTHAGEPAWDQVCVQLAWQQHDLNQREAAPDEPQTTLRERALTKAISQLGVKESPAGSNVCPYSDWYGMVGPWCAMFVTWAYETVGDSPAFIKGARYAYVPYIVDDARGARYGLSVTSSPLPGDVVVYNWGGSSSADGYYFDHVGLFEKWVGASSFTACEGNTSTGNDSNGGEVQRRTRDVNAQGTLFIRVAEP